VDLTLLLDLDGSLLDTNLPEFVPAYFRALADHLSTRVTPEIMLPALVAGTRRMTTNADPRFTLQEVFEAEFYARIGIPKAELAPSLARFYADVFPRLGALTSRRAEAEPFVAWARASHFRLAIATDPLFPALATIERVRWAGLDPASFAIVSAFEEFHFSKDHSAFYAEVLGRLGWPDGAVLMVGDDLQRDIRPAERIGLQTYLLRAANETVAPSDDGRAGTLPDLQTWIQHASAELRAPNGSTRDAVMAILLTTPAVLDGMTRALAETDWLHEAAPGDWSLVELVCHLRDTEREIHHGQLRRFDDEKEPFIPRPDAGVWARQRPYRDQDGRQALREFAAARLETLAQLGDLSEAEWNRRARHAIFGPSTFLEVIGFMAEHDRLHIRQASRTLVSGLGLQRLVPPLDVL